ncbi:MULTISPECIES: hypothetical protein [Nitrosomonas]|uniref:hypothetical protein n=1 Tax=Nitrosomonas TaxID=914 RepID=UPI00130DC175|nr:MULTISPECIES: hypothetical protein [Nitrosomonas]UVS60879.1 hypothetical protein NX761_15480 [Nitrosomonas sp. PLL12]
MVKPLRGVFYAVAGGMQRVARVAGTAVCDFIMACLVPGLSYAPPRPIAVVG